MELKHLIENNIWTYLSTDIVNTDTTIVIDIPDLPYNSLEDLLPVEDDEFIHLTITDAEGLYDIPSRIEIVEVESIMNTGNGLELVVKRGVEKTLRFNFKEGAVVYLAHTKESIDTKADRYSVLLPYTLVTSAASLEDPDGNYNTTFATVDLGEEIILYSDTRELSPAPSQLDGEEINASEINATEK